ncbi:hypothetical protein KSC_075850 [Ktedonobacter sp. SOSP1-52]|nr:hypothetical protein KSC_075850 [Ktedonobacter sp. SOSP1-52]
MLIVTCLHASVKQATNNGGERAFLSYPPNTARLDLYQHTGPFGDKREEQLADIRQPPYNQKHDET